MPHMLSNAFLCFPMLDMLFICFNTLLYAFYMLLKAKVSQQQEMMLALCITGFCFAEAGKKGACVTPKIMLHFKKLHPTLVKF